MGEWIEIPCTGSSVCSDTSHPSWVSGLKFHKTKRRPCERLSRPSWVSGLKDEPDLSFNEVGFLHAFSQPFI